MSISRKIVDDLVANDVSFVTTVPCKQLAGVIEVKDKDLGPVLQSAIDSDETTISVCKCDSGNIKLPVITQDPVAIRHRIREAVKA